MNKQPTKKNYAKKESGSDSHITSARFNEIISTQSRLLQIDFDLNKFMSLVVEQMMQLTPATGVVIELVDNEDMVYRAATGSVSDYVGFRLPIKNSITGLCVLSKKVLRADDTETDTRVNREACRKVNARSLVVAPLFYQDKPIGVLKILSKKASAFSEVDVQTLQLMAGFIASGIANKSHFEELLIKNNKLKEAEERFHLLIESSQDYAIFMLDSKGIIKTWNMGATHLLGFTEEEIIGQPFQIIYLPEAIKNNLPKNKMQLAKEKGKFEEESLCLKQDGTIFWTHSVITAMHDSNNQFMGFAVILRDLTESKKIEALQNEFVSIVSHELRTPLTSIRGSLALLVKGTLGKFSPKVLKLLEIAYQNSERLSRLINDILDVQKLNANKMQFNIQSYNLSDLIKDTVIANKMYAEQMKVEIIPDISDQHCLIRVDQDRFYQVMANLLSNAIKFSPTAGKIIVKMKKGDETVRVSIIDQGSGIPLEFQPRIFQKFSQANTSNVREHPGTGLGLNITKTLIEKFGGTINFETSQKGSTFYFDLPIVHSDTMDTTV